MNAWLRNIACEVALLACYTTNQTTRLYGLVVVWHLSPSLEASAFHSHFENTDWPWQFSSCSFTPSISLRRSVRSNVHIPWQLRFLLAPDKIFFPSQDFLAGLFLSVCVCESVCCICKGDGCSQNPEVIHLRPTAHGGRLTGFLLPMTDGAGFSHRK